MLAGAEGSPEGGSTLRLIHVVVGQVLAETPCHLASPWATCVLHGMRKFSQTQCAEEIAGESIHDRWCQHLQLKSGIDWTVSNWPQSPTWHHAGGGTWDRKARRQTSRTSPWKLPIQVLQGGGVGVLCGRLFLLLGTCIGKGRGHTAKVKDCPGVETFDRKRPGPQWCHVHFKLCVTFRC